MVVEEWDTEGKPLCPACFKRTRYQRAHGILDRKGVGNDVTNGANAEKAPTARAHKSWRRMTKAVFPSMPNASSTEIILNAHKGYLTNEALKAFTNEDLRKELVARLQIDIAHHKAKLEKVKALLELEAAVLNGSAPASSKSTRIKSPVATSGRNRDLRSG